MTEKQRNYYIERHKNSQIYSLFNAYKNPSELKQRAYFNAYHKMISYNGNNLKIMSFNKFQFTCGFLFNCNGQRYLKVFTKSRTFDIKVMGV